MNDGWRYGPDRYGPRHLYAKYGITPGAHDRPGARRIDVYEQRDFVMWKAKHKEYLYKRKVQWIMDNVETVTYGKPIRIFYANLLRHGIRVSLNDGKLKVSGATENLSPAYREEIVKRAGHLVEFLEPQPPEPLAKYFHRLISVDEVREAVGVAKQMQVKLRQTPVDGGWLLEVKAL